MGPIKTVSRKRPSKPTPKPKSKKSKSTSRGSDITQGGGDALVTPLVLPLALMVASISLKALSQDTRATMKEVSRNSPLASSAARTVS